MINTKKATIKKNIKKNIAKNLPIIKTTRKSDDYIEAKLNNTKIVNKQELLITLKNVSKSYGSLKVLENVNTKIYRGDRIGVIGPNGEGKSTIVEVILRVKKPTRGEIEYVNPKMVIGVQFQDSNYPRSLKVISMINYYVDAYKLNRETIGLENLIDYFELRPLLKKLINSLSGGQKQRLNILLSVMNNPELIILDELTTGLDIEVRDRMKDIVKHKVLHKPETTLLLVSHNMTEVEELCNRVWFISGGKILYNMTIEEVKAKYQHLVDFTDKIFHDIRAKKQQTKVNK